MEIDLEDTGGVGVNKEYESCGRCLELQDRIMIAKDKYAQLELDFGNIVSEIELLEGKLGFIEREKLEVECEVRALKQRIESLEKNSTDDVEEDDIVTQLMIENKVLECEKNKAESEVEVWKVKCKDLEIQVMDLQKRLSAGTMKTNSNLPSIVRIEAEIKANEDKEDVSGTPPVNVSLKQYSDAGVLKEGYKCELKSRVIKGLNFANERSPNKKISPSTPGGRPPFAPIDISDSDDDLNTTHVRSLDLDRKRNARDEMELSSKDIDQEETNCYNMRRPNLLTPRAKRVRRGVSYIVSSESESENDDNIPICNLGSKSLFLNDSCSMDKPKEHTPRTRLTRLRNRESRDVTRKSSYKNTENVDEDEIEEVDSSSEGESLGGFIVSNSDVSESGPASNSYEISRDDCSVVLQSSMKYDEIMSGLRRERKGKTEWEYEADMLADFGRYPELCMKAVCALYRQQTSEEQSCKATLNLNGRGFSQIHALSSVVKIDMEIDLEDTGGVGVNKEYESCGRCLEVHDRIMIAKDKYAQLELDFGKKVSEIELLEGKLGFIEREKLEVECEVRALKQRIESLEKITTDDGEEDDTVTQLIIENKVLECEKNKAENEVEVWKVKCKDLEIQLMELQKRLSAGTMEKSSNLPSIVRVEAEINANENKKDVSGTPPVNVSFKHYSDAGLLKGGYKCELKSRVRKGLNFANERSPNKKISPTTPGGRPPFAPIDISDSDDDLNTAHLRSLDLDRKRNARDEMELSSKDIDQEETNCYNGKRPNLLTPRAKRVRRGVSYIVSSESESDNDDNIPICRLKSKSLSLNDSLKEQHTPRRRLTRLRHRESRNVTRKSSYKNTENVDEDEIEEVDSSSEGESLGGFIVSNSDVSESGPASNNDEISRDDDCSGVSESSMEYDEIMSGLRREKKDKTEWEYEADMLADFGRSHELCMKAVCALYRQQTSEEQSCKATLNLNGRGFSQIHALSGSELAEFLTDGDPHCDVIKSVEELREFNPNGVELCRKYATHYSKQLFEIYKNEEDPHFHP